METRTVLLLFGIVCLGVLVGTDVIDMAVNLFARYGEQSSLVALLLAGSAFAGSMIHDPW